MRNLEPKLTNLELMRAIVQDPRVSQRDLSRSLGISLGGVNYAMRSLVAKGLVKVQNFRSADNRLRYAYVLTPKGILEKASLTKRFLAAKLVEYEALQNEISTLQQELASMNQPRATLGEADLARTNPKSDPIESHNWKQRSNG